MSDTKYQFSDFINRQDKSIKSQISSAKNLRQLFNSLGKKKGISKARIRANITNPSRASFKFMLPLNNKSKVLDLGCGYGSISLALSPHVKHVYSQDLDSTRLQFTRKRASLAGAKNITCVLASNSNKLAFATNSMDIVLVNGLLEWIPTSNQGKPEETQIAFLKEIRRVLKPSGVMYLGIENRIGYRYFLGKPDDHSHLLFGSLLPRLLANFYSKIVSNKPYRTYTYSWWGYQHLLKKAKLDILSTYYPSPNYKYIEHIYSQDINRNHQFKIGQNLQTSLLNDFRNLVFTPVFLKFFASSFSIIAGNTKQKSLIEVTLGKHFENFTLKKYTVNRQSQKVDILLTSKHKPYLLKFDLLNNQTSIKPAQRLSKSSHLIKYFAHSLVPVKKLFSKLFIKSLLFLEPIIPKDKNLVIFGAMNGNHYGDNSKYLYQWLLKSKKYPHIKKVWLTKNRSVYQKLKKQNKPIYLYNSIMGTLVLFRANLACFTNSFKDFALSHQLAPKRIKLLSLRHGRSVKRVRFARLKHKLLKAEKRSRLQEASQTIGVISTSKFISEIQEECLRLGKSKHFITGYPRLDHLLKPRKNSKYSKTILYAPTWRHGRQQTRFFPFKDYNPQKLIKFLEDHHILLLLRPHVNDWVKYPKLQDQLNQLASLSTHIKLATHYQVADIYTILPSIDVLISDYSSIYHDFLLLDKPILLIPYDFAKFEKENGFLYNYQKLAPGPIIKTQRSLLAHINKDNYVSKREVLRNKIFQYQDTGSSARVAKLLNKLMQS